MNNSIVGILIGILIGIIIIGLVVLLIYSKISEIRYEKIHDIWRD